MFRIPKIEEFVEGFEFEVYMKSGGGSFGITDVYIDVGNQNQPEFHEQLAVNKLPTIEQWEKYTVPKLDKLGLEYAFAFSLHKYLKNNKIRTNK